MTEERGARDRVQGAPGFNAEPDETEADETGGDGPSGSLEGNTAGNAAGNAAANEKNISFLGQSAEQSPLLIKNSR